MERVRSYFLTETFVKYMRPYVIQIGSISFVVVAAGQGLLLDYECSGTVSASLNLQRGNSISVPTYIEYMRFIHI